MYRLDVLQEEIKMDFVALVNKVISIQVIDVSKISIETLDVIFLKIIIIVWNANLGIS